jgi:hypothetical protein
MAHNDLTDESDFDPYALVDPYDKTVKRKVKQTSKARRRLLLAFLAAALVVIASAGAFIVYDNLRTADISAYAQTGISISGLEEQDFIVTPEGLSALKIVKTSTTGSGMGEGGESKAGTVYAYGPSLEALVASHGYAVSDFRSITFLCKDGYRTTLRPSRLGDEEVILSFAAGQVPLAPYQQPLRLIIPGGDTGQWCFGILRIEFTLNTGDDADDSADDIYRPQESTPTGGADVATDTGSVDTDTPDQQGPAQ